MKKMMFMGLGMAVLLCGCSQAKKDVATDQAEAAVADTAVIVSEPKPEDVMQRVKDIYADVSQTYADDAMPNQMKDLASLYCSEDWLRMLGAIREADKDKDMGFFDADYWIMGQDWGNVHADNIAVQSLDGDKATATLDLHNFDQVTKVRLALVNEKGQWMIDDFVDVTHDLDWKQAMKEYLDEQKK